MNTKGYSLWLIPEKTVATQLSKIIKIYSDILKFPYFEPHITLLGEIEEKPDSKVLDTLFKKHKTQSVEVKAIKSGSFYFKCLYIEIKNNSRLKDLNMNVSRLLNINKEFLPHLSLVYGNYPQNTKNKIISEIKKDFLSNKFIVERIDLYETIGKISDWRKIDEFNLSMI